MQNEATTAITNADMKKVILLSGHEAEILDFSKIATADGVEKTEEIKKPA